MSAEFAHRRAFPTRKFLTKASQAVASVFHSTEKHTIMMNRIINTVSSIRRDAPIVGYGRYLKYRFGSRFGQTRPMQVRVNGYTVWVRPGTPDLRVCFQSLRNELDILSNIYHPDFDGLIIDAGGYIGTAALRFAKMYPKATVVTIEPSSDNYKILLKNVADSDNIVPVHAAIHITSQENIQLFDRGSGAWGFSIAAHDDSTAEYLETVNTVTLGEIARRFDDKLLGIVKMDIEGGEHTILGNDQTLDTANALFIELHDRIVPGCTERFRAFSRNRWLLNAGGEKYLSLRREMPPAVAVGH